MPRSIRLVVLVALVAVIAPASALAAPIIIYNTGAASPGLEDPNWDLIGGTAYVTSGWPVASAWMANTSTSKWISPKPSYGDGDIPQHTYQFSTSFEIPVGYNPEWSSFQFRVAVDNQVSAVRLNGQSLGVVYTSIPVTEASFKNWSNYYTVDNWFVQGTNVLTFDVFNGGTITAGNPAGLRVEFLNAQMPAVPEPASLVLLGIGLVGAAGIARRRRRR